MWSPDEFPTRIEMSYLSLISFELKCQACLRLLVYMYMCAYTYIQVVVKHACIYIHTQYMYIYIYIYIYCIALLVCSLRRQLAAEI